MQTHGTVAQYALMVAIATAMGGCAVVKSNQHTEPGGSNLPQPQTQDAKLRTTRSGLVYSLPKGAVQLTAERKQVAAEDIKKAKEAAEAAKAKAEISLKAWNTSKENLTKAEGELKTAPDAAKEKLQEAVALAQATVNYATIVKDTDAAVAKAAQEKYDGIADKLDKWIETVSLAVLPNVPDGKARYVADVSHNATRDDNVKLSVANGLLTSSTATATDQLPNILLSIAQTIGATSINIPKATRGWIASQSSERPADVPNCSPYSVSTVFDPTDHADTHEKLKRLNEKNPGFVVTIGKVSSNDGTPAAQDLGMPKCNNACDGLYYRVPIAVETHVASKDLAQCKLASSPVAFSSVVVVPDSTHTYFMPTRAGAFTTSKLTFAFKEGMPIDYSVEQPSEIASIASIPVQIAKALVSIPAEIIQLRVNHDTQANALIGAKTAEMSAQIEQLRAQQALDAARDAVAAGVPIPSPPADDEEEEEASQ